MQLILYADDLVLFCTSFEEAHKILNIINNICKRFGLNISFKKTKTMVFGDESSAESKSLFSVDGVEIENVRQFCYLGHTIYNTKNASYTDLRVSSALSKFNEIGNVLKDGEINIKTRKKTIRIVC